MKKLVIPVLALGLTLSVSCQKDRQPEAAAAKPAAQAATAAPKIEPEMMYKFKIDRLALDNAVNAGYLEMLKAAKAYDQKLEKEISDYERHTVDRYKQLREKYADSITDLELAEQNPEFKIKFDEYLSANPELKKPLEDAENENTRLENEISIQMERIHPRPKLQAADTIAPQPAATVTTQPASTPAPSTQSGATAK